MAEEAVVQEVVDVEIEAPIVSDDAELDDVSELLIEEISIDGMCGVY